MKQDENNQLNLFPSEYEREREREREREVKLGKRRMYVPSSLRVKKRHCAYARHHVMTFSRYKNIGQIIFLSLSLL